MKSKINAKEIKKNIKNKKDKEENIFTKFKNAELTLDSIFKILAIVFIFAIMFTMAVDFAHNDGTKRKFNSIDLSLSIDTILGMGEDIDFYFQPLKYYTPHKIDVTSNKVITGNDAVKPFSSSYIPNKKITVMPFNFSLFENDATHIVLKKRNNILKLGEFTRVDEVDFTKVTVKTVDDSLNDNTLYLYMNPYSTTDQEFITQSIKLALDSKKTGDNYAQIIGTSPEKTLDAQPKLEYFKKLFDNMKNKYNNDKDLTIVFLYNENSKDYYQFYFAPKNYVTVSDQENKKFNELEQKSDKLARILREQIQTYTKKINTISDNDYRDSNLIFGSELSNQIKSIPEIALLNPSHVGVVVTVGSELKDFSKDNSVIAKVLAKTIEKYYDEVGKYLVKTYGASDESPTIAKITGKEPWTTLVSVPKDYVVPGYSPQLQQSVLDAFIEMSKAAKDGITKDNIQIPPIGNGVEKLFIESGYRNFDDQLYIWNGKLLNVLGKQYSDKAPFYYKNIDDILTFSSLPGTSRHHWGTDLDIQTLSDQSKLTVITDWIDKYAKYFGFCRPYVNDLGGYKPEEWHLSYYSLAQQYYDVYLSSVGQNDADYIRFYDDNGLALKPQTYAGKTIENFPSSRFKEIVNTRVTRIDDGCKVKTTN